MVIRHKYGAKSTVVNGLRFASKKEARYYQELLIRVKAGEVIFFLMQTPFHLAGGVKYVCDFQEFHADGSVHFIEVKGFDTPMGKAKRKLTEGTYPVKIEVV
jgi:hypothetical protein